MARGVVKVRRTDGTTEKSDPFDIDKGVIQGGMESPWAFILGITCVLHDADPQRRNLDYDIRQGVQLLRKGMQPAHTGAAYEAYVAAEDRFSAVEEEGPATAEEKKKLEFERLWFNAVKKGAGALHMRINAAKKDFENKRAELRLAPEDRPTGWTAAAPDADWTDELEERERLKKCFHPGHVRLPRNVVPQCIICDTARLVSGYCEAYSELEFQPPEGYWERLRRECGSVVTEDQAAVERMMQEFASEGSSDDVARENIVDCANDDGDEERGGVGEEADDASGSPRQVIVDCDDAGRANYLVGTTDLPADDSSAEPGHHPVTRSGPI